MEKIIFYTACSRPQNLQKMYESIINGSAETPYKWIVCFDEDNNNRKPIIIGDAVFLYDANKDSIVGNNQRNKCIDYAFQNFNKDAWMYCIDDDNVLFKNLVEELNQVPLDVDFVSFGQGVSSGHIRLFPSEEIKVGNIDTANFAVRLRAIGETRWEVNRYEADGIFAEDISKKTGIKKMKIDKYLSYYNYLRS